MKFFDRSVPFAACFPESEHLGSVSLLTGMVLLHGWLVGWLAGWLVGWLVGWLAGRLGWLVGWLV